MELSRLWNVDCKERLLEVTWVVARIGQSRIQTPCMSRVGQNCIYAPYMTVYLVISLPKIPHIHRIYMVLANPMYEAWKIPATIIMYTYIFVLFYEHWSINTARNRMTRLPVLSLLLTSLLAACLMLLNDIPTKTAHRSTKQRRVHTMQTMISEHECKGSWF